MQRYLAVLIGGFFSVAFLSAADLSPIQRALPNVGQALSAPDRERLSARVLELKKLFKQPMANVPLIADVQIFIKAVDFALRFNEFYVKNDVAKADWALQQAKERMEKMDSHPWATQKGLVIRGFTSALDGSVQPYGLVIPEGLDARKPAPLYVWLHGRSSSETDLHFISGHAHDAGLVHPDDSMVLHAFGRQCIGFKGPGEQDVLEAIAHVEKNYYIDHERIVLMGFSMGGGGSKSLGCHYTDHFCCIHTGAGYSETAQFMGLKPENFPPAYEQKLWGVNDVPCYVRNLFNIPFSCYSGEKDGQIQAARVLEESFKEHGKTLVHLIGPNTGHGYHPETLKQALAMIKEAVVKGRPKDQSNLSFQTRTLEYAQLFWLEALGLNEHWKDSRIDAQAKGEKVELTTINISRLRVTWPALMKGGSIIIDGAEVKIAKVPVTGADLIKDGDAWRIAKPTDDDGLRKRPGQQGPIDDIFNQAFLVVEPTGTSLNEKFQRWSAFEAAHFHERWASAIRGDLRVKKDSEVTDDDLRKYHVLLWGDATSNTLITKILPKLPITWDDKIITVGQKSFSAAEHALAMIYPNPLSPTKYVVLNSALTWRESNDRNNSLQNPKLPDWAVINFEIAPNQDVPGKIVATDFFDERWQLKP
jgi:predicted esterase